MEDCGRGEERAPQRGNHSEGGSQQADPLLVPVRATVGHTVLHVPRVRVQELLRGRLLRPRMRVLCSPLHHLLHSNWERGSVLQVRFKVGLAVLNPRFKAASSFDFCCDRFLQRSRKSRASDSSTA